MANPYELLELSGLLLFLSAYRAQEGRCRAAGEAFRAGLSRRQGEVHQGAIRRRIRHAPQEGRAFRLYLPVLRHGETLLHGL